MARGRCCEAAAPGLSSCPDSTRVFSVFMFTRVISVPVTRLRRRPPNTQNTCQHEVPIPSRCNHACHRHLSSTRSCNYHLPSTVTSVPSVPRLSLPNFPAYRQTGLKRWVPMGMLLLCSPAPPSPRGHSASCEASMLHAPSSDPAICLAASCLRLCSARWSPTSRRRLLMALSSAPERCCGTVTP